MSHISATTGRIASVSGFPRSPRRPPSNAPPRAPIRVLLCEPIGTLPPPSLRFGPPLRLAISPSSPNGFGRSLVRRIALVYSFPTMPQPNRTGSNSHHSRPISEEVLPWTCPLPLGQIPSYLSRFLTVFRDLESLGELLIAPFKRVLRATIKVGVGAWQLLLRCQHPLLSSPPPYRSSFPCPFPLLRARLVGTSWDDVKLTHLRSPIRFRSRARPLSSISGHRCRSQSSGLSLPRAEPPFPCSRIDCPPWTLGSCAMSLSHWTSEFPFQTADLRSGCPQAT